MPEAYVPPIPPHLAWLEALNWMVGRLRPTEWLHGEVARNTLEMDRVCFVRQARYLHRLGKVM